MKIWAKRAVMGGMLIIYALLFGEYYIRLFSPEPLMPRYVTGAPSGIRMNIQNAIYRQKTPEADVEIRINKQGFRSDKIYSKIPKKAVCRIAIFGDSFFMGYEVNIEDSYAYQLEKVLNSRGIKTEVINFSVSGFGTAESLIALQSQGLLYQPDIVIFQWHISDLDDNIRSNLYKLNAGRLTRNANSYLPAIKTRDYLMQFSVYRWLISKSQLYSLIREKAAGTSKQILVWLSALNTTRASTKNANELNIISDKKYKQTLSIKLLREAKHISEENHAGFVVVDIPVRKSRTVFISSLDYLNQPINKYMQVVSPMNIFQANANQDTKIYYEEGHGHLSPLGNYLLANETAKNLIDNNTLHKCSK